MVVKVAYFELFEMFLALRQFFSNNRFKPFNSSMNSFAENLSPNQKESIYSYGILTNGYLSALKNLLKIKLSDSGSDDTHILEILKNPHCLFLSEDDPINDEQILSDFHALLGFYQSEEHLSSSIISTVSTLWREVFSSIKAQYSRDIFEKTKIISDALLENDAISYLSTLSDRFYVEKGVVHFRIKPEFCISIDEIENIIIMPSVFSSRNLTFWYEGKNLLFFISLEAHRKKKFEPSDMLLLMTSSLNDRSRLKILKLLFGKNCTAGELAHSLQLNPSTVSRHLKVFKDAGFINIFSNDRKKIIYAINKAEIDNFLDKLNQYLTDQE